MLMLGGGGMGVGEAEDRIFVDEIVIVGWITIQ